jgi:hypothetical protein
MFRRLFIAGLLLVVVSTAVAVRFLSCSPLVVAHAKVRNGMTLADVKQAAGHPGDFRTTVGGLQTWARPSFDYANFETWFTDEGILVVYFNSSGTVVGKDLVDYEPSWLEKLSVRIRSWL